ncbi:MAG TPA: hypothetical protein ENK04_12050 [Gammaproteobacteria bacterium]|nr:hypothetical protein [Gammaproteobacteria bacterium]
MPKQSGLLTRGSQLETPLVDVEFYDNGITVIRLQDHEHENRLSTSLIESLVNGFERVRAMDQCRVVILAGLDKHFIMDDEARKNNHWGLLLQTTIVEFDRPVVAAMAGNASGMGWLLGLCCDGVVYADESFYCYSSMNYGLVPGDGATLVFPLKLENYLAREILFTGKNYSGAQLKAMTACVSVAREKVEETAFEMAGKWASFSPKSRHQLKAQLSQQLRAGLKKNHQQEASVFQQLQKNGFPVEAVKKQDLTTARKIEINSDVVLVEAYDNGVVIVKMCDRESKNTFSETLAAGLLKAFEHINTTADYKVVVLTGYDNYFACGGNKEGLLAIQRGEVTFTDAKVHALTLACEIPVIAAMQGHGIGAGWALGMFCDFPVFSKESTYTSNYMRYGFTPGAGATLIFPARFDDDLAWEILFTAKEYKGAELKARGITMPVVPRNEVVDCAMEIANRLALSSRLALTLLKTQLSRGLRDQLSRVFQREVEMHEKTFVGNTLVLENIQSGFIEHSAETDKLPQTVISDNNSLEGSDHMDLETLRSRLCQGLASELYLDVDAIDNDVQFIDMGLDSVTGVSWIKNINKTFGLDVAATKIYDYPTVNLLAGYLSGLVKPSGESRKENISGMNLPGNADNPPVNEKKIYKAGSGNFGNNPLSFAKIRAILRNSLAGELYLDAEGIDDDTQFIDMGLDSVTGVSWVRKINESLDLGIVATKVYDYPNINMLAKYIVEEVGKKGICSEPDESADDEKQNYNQEKTENITADTAPVIEVMDNDPPALRFETVSNSQSADRHSGKSAPESDNEEARNHDDKHFSASPPAIAIIGMSGQFPQSGDLNAFWQNLANGKNCISAVPKNRWDMSRFFNPDPNAPGKTYCDHMGVLEDVDKFDPLFFNISPAEAKFIDPQQRLFLENCWSSMEDAGLNPPALSGSRCGVFVGCSVSDYGQGQTAQDLMGGATSILSARMAYLLDLKGPCMAIDTACSSSLVAIAEACNSLTLGTSDMAFAGGVCVLSGPSLHIMASKSGMLSKDNRCFTFDARANGFVPGEGVGVIVLKRLSDAIRDRDSIAGVIRGWGVNQDGKTNGITAPSVNSQILLEKEIYERFNIDPETISLVEAHGTGTPLGDPIEVEALTTAFRTYTRKKSYCALGSVKSNIGHLMPAAGVSGAIKVLLALKHKMLPPTINFERLNEHIALQDSPFYINTELKRWDEVPGQARRAAVSSFGFSGTNAHLVIEEYLPEPQPQFKNENHFHPASHQTPLVFVLSAKTSDQLNIYAGRMLDYVQSRENLNLTDMTYTLQVGRGAMDFRLAILLDSRQGLLEDLQTFIKGESSATVMSAKADKRQAAVEVFDTDEDAEVLLNTWIKKKKLARVAKLWVSGLDLDWQQMYVNERPRRISLPTYPFADERYWNAPGKNHLSDEQVSHGEISLPEDTMADRPAHNVLQKLTEIVSKITSIAIERIDIDADFEALGLDSIMIASLNHKLESWVGRLEPALFFKYKTLSSLAGYIEKSCVENTRQPSPEPVAIPPVNKPEKRPSGNQDIAIIGMSGRYPHANTLAEYWNNLCEGRDCISEIPLERFDYRPLFSQDKNKSDSIYSKWGGFLDDVDKFDALFFNVSPQDARAMDPQERIFLENTWECLESAGYIGPDWQKHSRNISVFAGATFNNYQLIAADAGGKLLSPVNSQMFSIANHVSYFFNFTGPSLTVDTACSSSLYAVHLACESIKRGESDMAIAGGVNLSLHPSKYFTICSRGFAASDGHCHAFAEGGDGYVPSEGVGTVLLKSYERAVADGDQILAIIKGTGVSHDGKTQNYTVPNPVAQTKAIEAAFAQADINPETVSYVEAHGTGTPLGDPIEITGLMDVFSKYTDKKQFCSIGSVKSNIGHGEAVAGVSQLTKTVLQMQHKTIVSSLLHSPLNPNIDFKETAFFVQQEKSPWQQPVINGEAVPRRAGVSSFGAGGVNVHVIVEEYTPEEKEPLSVLADQSRPVIIPFSAHVHSQLQEQVSNFTHWLKDNYKNCEVDDIAYTLQCKRAPLRFRLAFVIKDKQDLLEQLTGYLEQESTGKTEKQYYEGDSKAPKDNVSFSDNSGEGRHYRERLIEQHDVHALSQLWVCGRDIGWRDENNDGNKRRCLSLPTYAFLKKRYWIKEPAVQHAETTGKPATVPTEILPGVEVENQGSINNMTIPAINNSRDDVTGLKGSAFLQSVVELSEIDREESFNGFIEAHIKSVLAFDPDDTLDANLGFFELGMESMQTMSLQQRLEKELSVELSDTALFDYPSINQLTGYLISIIPWDQLEGDMSESGSVPSDSLNETDSVLPPDNADLSSENECLLDDAIPEDIENLSEEDVIAELLSELES